MEVANLKKNLYTLALILSLVLAPTPVLADEGMWTLDNLPLAALKSNYSFVPPDGWTEKVRLASVRLNDGGSGSFITPTGLLLTNHHMAVGQLQKMSNSRMDYVRDGYYARTLADEMRCPDLEVNVLMDMKDVTGRVNEARKNLSGQAALKALKAEISRIEKENLEKTGLRSEVVSLYQGGEYWLYSSKKYTDLRLVFAPEKQMAFFGGDSDNFTYPRHDLDFAIFRVYENDKPLSTSNFFRMNPRGAGEHELVFVSGHPGSTSRLLTVSQYLLQRDILYPERIKALKRRISLLENYALKGGEEQRRAATLIYGAQNALKALSGEYAGLRDPHLLNMFRNRENEFREKVKNNPSFIPAVKNSWAVVDKAMKANRELFKLLNYRTFRGLRLPTMAADIVLCIQESGKPDVERLDGYHDSQIESLRFRLLSPAPFYLDLEKIFLADAIKESREGLGGDDPFVRILLGGKSPEERARELVEGSRLTDPEVRKNLLDGGPKALAASNDPLIRLALELSPLLREKVRLREKKIESVAIPALEMIARARFILYGKTTYPDATFTLRLAYGKVDGYPMNGTQAQPWTTFYGLYDRSAGFGGQKEYALSPRFREKESALNHSCPLDFVLSADIIGGNSGSPVLNSKLECVGVVFDGNIESLAGRFVYDIEKNRAVAVHAGAVIETLRNMYDAGPLVEEILTADN
jgi:hypothetical protein